MIGLKDYSKKEVRGFQHVSTTLNCIKYSRYCFSINMFFLYKAYGIDRILFTCMAICSAYNWIN